jgi:UDP-glucuronate decarboxylase
MEGVALKSALRSPVVQEDLERMLIDAATPLRALEGQTLLVTGAAGFLCSYLVDLVAEANRSLFARPCRVLAVDNYQTGLPDRLAHLGADDGVEFVQHDVTRPLDLERSPEWVMHGASIASPTFYRRFPLETIDVNVTGTRLMLELARAGARGMLFISSSETYGDPVPEAIPTREDYWGNVSFTGPRACYDESKRLGETLCTVFHRVHGVPVKVVRPFNVYGPGQRLDDQRIIPDLMSAALDRRTITLFSDGRATRSFCYVTDAVTAMLWVLTSNANGEAFNIGNDQEEVTIRTAAEVMAGVVAPPALEIQHIVSNDANYLTDNPQRRCPDLTKLRSAFDWRPNVSLQDGLARTYRSYQESDAR